MPHEAEKPKPEEIKRLVEKFGKAKIGIIGDACVDIYWRADMKKSELSRETPHFPLPVVSEKFSMGAGANVLANVASLGAQVKMITCIGNDWRGIIFTQLLQQAGMDTSGIVTYDEFITPAYCKPIRCGISGIEYEDPRIDFSNSKKMPQHIENSIIQKLEDAVQDMDVLIVCDQLEYGVITQRVRSAVCETGKKITVIVDSRNRAGLYKNVIIKPNEVEAAALVNEKNVPAELLEWAKEMARKLSEQNGKPAIITLGKLGAVWCSGGRAVLIPSYPVEGNIDIVGAGDSFVSGLACSMACGASGETAVAVGNLVSAVTIQKIGETGTASVEEIMLQCSK